MSVRRLVDEGVSAALQYAVPVARRLRFALSEDQMEREVGSLRRELDESRAALRLQTARCRQLVAAYSARLRAARQLRDHQDQQLALVLRALVALEARLRREQKAIRAQLGQRDAIIHQQQAEISRLRAQTQAAHGSPPAAGLGHGHGHGHAPASRTGSGSTPSQLIVVNHTCGQDSACDQDQAEQGHGEGRRRKSAHPAHAAHETVVDAMSHLRHQEAALRVLELVGPANTATPMPLLNGETACIVEPPADFIEDHDAVLDAVTPPPDVVASYNEMNRECQELASMAASLRQAGDKDKSVCFQDNPVLECVNLILLRDQEDFQEEHRGRDRGQAARGRGRARRAAGESPPPPPASDPPAWYNTASTKDAAASRQSRPTPPALPPKPPRLVGQRPPPPVRATKSPTPTSSTTPKDSHDAPRTPTSTRRLQLDSPTSPLPPSSPSSSSVSSDEHEDANDALRQNFEEFNLDDCDIEDLGKEADGDVSQNDAVKAETEGGDVRARPEGDGAESGKPGGLAGAGVLVQEPEQPLLTAPAEAPQQHLSNGLSNGLANGLANGLSNGLPNGLPNGLSNGLPNGLAGTLAQQLAQLAPANYDSFLEATGLSNKSILTPSRMLSNHRSVLKPKDVKHRSRVKAQQGDRCAPGPAQGPTVKYWTEPFL